MANICAVDGCGRPVKGNGWCGAHYLRVKKHGDPQAWKPVEVRGKTAAVVCRIDGCGKPIAIKHYELCWAHYLRQYRKGSAEAPVAFIRGDDIARFWSYVDKRGPDDCWPWTGLTRTGYGVLGVNGKMLQATRFHIAVILGEPLSDHEEVCHRCDNPPCVNRRHLFVSDHLGNMRDMDAKGRCLRARGEEVWKAKLTERQVKEIRARYQRYGRGPNGSPALAKEFGVTKSAIHSVVNRKSWKHI